MWNCENGIDLDSNQQSNTSGIRWSTFQLAGDVIGISPRLCMRRPVIPMCPDNASNSAIDPIGMNSL
jgi:hypothetical protein